MAPCRAWRRPSVGIALLSCNYFLKKNALGKSRAGPTTPAGGLHLLLGPAPGYKNFSRLCSAEDFRAFYLVATRLYTLRSDSGP